MAFKKTVETQPSPSIVQSDADQEGITALAAAAAEEVGHAADAVDHDTGEVFAGVRARRAWSNKQFISDPDWINTNIVARGKGYHQLVGRIVGGVTASERRMNTLEKGGKKEEVASIALIGLFTAIKLNGDQASFSLLFLPAAFSEQIEASLQLADIIKPIQIDIDVGLEATGKTIPYEWTITSYIEGQAQRALRQLVSRRQIGQPARSIGQPAGSPRLIG